MAALFKSLAKWRKRRAALKRAERDNDCALLAAFLSEHPQEAGDFGAKAVFGVQTHDFVLGLPVLSALVEAGHAAHASATLEALLAHSESSLKGEWPVPWRLVDDGRLMRLHDFARRQGKAIEERFLRALGSEHEERLARDSSDPSYLAFLDSLLSVEKGDISGVIRRLGDDLEHAALAGGGRAVAASSFVSLATTGFAAARLLWRHERREQAMEILTLAVALDGGVAKQNLKDEMLLGEIAKKLPDLGLTLGWLGAVRAANLLRTSHLRRGSRRSKMPGCACRR